MAYLKNSSVNLLNVHYAIHAIAMNAAGVFFPVFLLRAGVSLPGLFGAIALLLAGRFVVRPLVLVLAPKYGLRPLVIFGVLFSAVPYLLLPSVHGLDLMLLGFCAASAIGEAFYWTSYHASFAYLGDGEHRGHQIGMREAVASVAGIAGPLIGGLALTQFGARTAFTAAALVQAVAALPLLRIPRIKVPASMPGGFRAARNGFALFACDGWMAAGVLFAWQVALFVSLGESFSAFGGALAVAGAAGAVASLVLGRHIDGGHGGIAVGITFAALTGLTLFRAGATDQAALAVIANACGAVVLSLYIPTLMTAVYNQAKQSSCPLRFHAAAEGGWDAGGATGCLLIALLTWAGVPLSICILTALPGIALSYSFLRRYYAAIAVPAPQFA
jgi:MFS family permease